MRWTKQNTYTLLLSLAFISVLPNLILSTASADQPGSALNPGQFLCKEAPLQLRWFTNYDSSTAFMDAGTATNTPLSARSRQARNALSNGWCASTDGMEFFSVKRVEGCDEVWKDIPNGGCIKVTVSPQSSNFESMWYTFRNALNR
jgi:hypothetical protein